MQRHAVQLREDPERGQWHRHTLLGPSDQNSVVATGILPGRYNLLDRPPQNEPTCKGTLRVPPTHQTSPRRSSACCCRGLRTLHTRTEADGCVWLLSSGGAS